ncbi:hypothetical protein LX70_01481 [Defluviimonas denitrificans]|jgi:predicted DNA repair protein MutK|uniref:Inner membrane protein YedI n=1 Tax=Albidovulum denitrificans TaxID=404881 RepID=A0A2S8SA26_9RHOB|nr:DUF808 domain-containing protein [Defluviimonas denitrificans]PQV57675.1 hypothetical protein LX70_01481 [Defluviimonas denitrificans]
MSGLLALLDDVAAIAKVAAASVDDIAGAAAKVGGKTMGILIDDTAVTPKYVSGFSAERELPIIWKISKGSIRNKIVILLPGLLLLSAFLPAAIPILLMMGGLYLCFEGAEKIYHHLAPHPDAAVEADFDIKDPTHLEQQKVEGAIKTDFILSAEIMTIALASVPSQIDTVWGQAGTLALVAIGVTALVYGSVALLVKMDDVGLVMASKGRLGATRALGRSLVRLMPRLMTILSTVGTAAMLWVGGNIVAHGLAEMGWPWLYDQIHHIAELATHGLTTGQGFAAWAVTATLDGIFGLALGLLLIPVGTRIVGPLWGKLTGKASAAH